MLNAQACHARQVGDVHRGVIASRLDNPDHVVSVATLAKTWRQSRTCFRLRGLAPLIVDPGLTGRIRGAFGSRLAQSASKESFSGKPCPWDPPCAFEALWRKQGRLSPDFAHASPWIIELDAVRGDLDVSLLIFGFANDWLASAVEAFAAALIHDVRWAGESGLYVPRVEIVRRRLVETQGVALPRPTSSLLLEFVTPLVTTGCDPTERPFGLLVGLVQRLEALARWHDVSLDFSTRRRAFANQARSLIYRFSDVDRITWTRGSRRQDREIPMRGITGQLEIEAACDLDEDLTTAFALGVGCHMGADIAFGCGRYEPKDRKLQTRL